MIKGIAGYGYFDELCIPIIENTAWEHELADSLGEAIAKVGPHRILSFPLCNAINLVKILVFRIRRAWRFSSVDTVCMCGARHGKRRRDMESAYTTYLKWP